MSKSWLHKAVCAYPRDWPLLACRIFCRFSQLRTCTYSAHVPQQEQMDMPKCNNAKGKENEYVIPLCGPLPHFKQISSCFSGRRACSESQQRSSIVNGWVVTLSPCSAKIMCHWCNYKIAYISQNMNGIQNCLTFVGFFPTCCHVPITYVSWSK